MKSKKRLSLLQYYFVDDTAVTGWDQIDGSWYYLHESGAMAANELVTGYWWLSSNGVRDYTYRGFWEQDSTGWRFGDSSGWYAHDGTVMINGKKYTFDSDGYMK